MPPTVPRTASMDGSEVSFVGEVEISLVDTPSSHSEGRATPEVEISLQPPDPARPATVDAPAAGARARSEDRQLADLLTFTLETWEEHSPEHPGYDLAICVELMPVRVLVPLHVVRRMQLCLDGILAGVQEAIDRIGEQLSSAAAAVASGSTPGAIGR